MIPFLKFLVLFLWITSSALGQDLNVIPDIVRPYIVKADQYKSINLMANISEKLLNVKQIGFDFDFLLKNEYDFIIVGSGPAGSVLAHRLSENKDWNILLLEAGKPESLANYIPIFVAYLGSTDYNWDYLLERNPDSCLGAINQQCGFPRGRVLGGTSSFNYMIYTRGNRHDFDRWEELGNEGWSYEDVLFYYKKHEKANLGEYSKSEFHNTNGELSVEFAPFRTALVDFYLAAARELGHDIIDYNGEKQIGTGYLQRTTLKGFRHSAASAFLKPIIKKRKNLHILTSALVTNVIIDPETKTALGVNFIRKNQTYSVYAKKEVILSAGAFHSPQLLMLSGIGPEDQLEKIGVEVIEDLPVGKIMYDHLAVPYPIVVLNTTGNSIHLKKLGLLEVLQLIKGTGPMTTPLGIEALTYGKAPDSETPPDYPDFELIVFSATYASDLGTGIAKEFRLSPEIYKKVFKPLESPEIDQMLFAPMQLQPKSKGRLYLKDNSIFSPPVFEHRYFEEEIDLENLLAGVKEGIRIVNTDVMQALGARVHDIPVPGCTHFKFLSDDYLRCVIRSTGVSVHHQVSTCKMGPEDDDEAVVDPKLRVYGIKNLRVADTSILPTQIAAHSNAVSFMIGEKLADMLKEEWISTDYDKDYKKNDSKWPFQIFNKVSKEKDDKKEEKLGSGKDGKHPRKRDKKKNKKNKEEKRKSTGKSIEKESEAIKEKKEEIKSMRKNHQFSSEELLSINEKKYKSMNPNESKTRKIKGFEINDELKYSGPYYQETREDSFEY